MGHNQALSEVLLLIIIDLEKLGFIQSEPNWDMASDVVTSYRQSANDISVDTVLKGKLLI